MSDVFVGDNDHGDTPLPPLSDLLWAEVTKLRQDKVRLEEDIVHFANELNEVTTQRDEARREVCAARRELCRNEAIIRLQRHRVHRDSEDVVGLAKEIAVERGWDCFKDNP